MLALVALICAGVTILFLLVSGAWTDRKYRRFEQTPSHYNWRGHVDATGSRRFMAWLAPVLFSALLIIQIGLSVLGSGETTNDDPEWALMLASAIFAVSQIALLWLLARWAREQDAAS